MLILVFLLIYNKLNLYVILTNILITLISIYISKCFAFNVGYKYEKNVSLNNKIGYYYAYSFSIQSALLVIININII